MTQNIDGIDFAHKFLIGEQSCQTSKYSCLTEIMGRVDRIFLEEGANGNG